MAKTTRKSAGAEKAEETVLTMRDLLAQPKESNQDDPVVDDGHEPEFWIVDRGRTLLWPRIDWPDDRRVRGKEGYVVDMNAPFERDWNKGQLRKLLTVEDAIDRGVIEEIPTKASPLGSAIARNRVRRWLKEREASVPVPTVEDQLRANDSAATASAEEKRQRGDNEGGIELDPTEI